MAIFVPYKQTRMEILVFSGVNKKGKKWNREGEMEHRGGSGGVDLL